MHISSILSRHSLWISGANLFAKIWKVRFASANLFPGDSAATTFLKSPMRVHYIRRLNTLLFEAYYDICPKLLQIALQIIFRILECLFYHVTGKPLNTYDLIILDGVVKSLYILRYGGCPEIRHAICIS